MPHFKTRILELPPLPFEAQHIEGDFKFENLYTSCNNPRFSLLNVKYLPKNPQSKEQHFFLEIKKTPQETLVRFDKNSRISPVEIIKNALEILAKKQTTLITHNLYGKNTIVDYKLPFIKNVNDFLCFEDLLASLPLKKPKIWLEIGFGSGRNLLFNAKENPEILHIGLEIHHPSLEQVARQIGLLGLNNVLILAYDARIFLELLPSNCLEKIFVHFPVPWDKKPHRRIFSQAFLKQSARVLEQEGLLQLRTDSYEYFYYAQNLAQNHTDFKIQIPKNPPQNLISKYEARWLRQNKIIYHLHLINTKIHKERTFDLNFTFPNCAFLPYKKQKIIKEHYFVHLEDALTYPNGTLFRVSFGDFNYPETRYIQRTNITQYFRENPLPTQANHDSHQTLCKLLYDIQGVTL
ncbi:MAG: tRNA (guanosine(46)-N7)-methyltransferase TrmB [Helicobacter sp.]|nr:tRNA (guanosine(46)-N7)-methyltransferase TrmB [Helicobacter sp.]